MQKSTICVDASVVVRVTTATSKPAVIQWNRWVATQDTIIAPALLHFEVVNALYRYQKQGLLSANAVEQLVKAAINLPILLKLPPGLHGRALALATAHGLSATYDAHYLALAELTGCNLWTCDEQFHERTKNSSSLIRLIV